MENNIRQEEIPAKSGISKANKFLCKKVRQDLHNQYKQKIAIHH